ncbi:ribonuclease H-like domain-containing protein [Daldinia caldariorum]|uniref:ribonuclease H-like domain-containing protein n=1 Tax=Daldinia caldariorum TaxID=326644 RepID=UPI002008C772|nr:ribonuclease H-like domain-containing protein [Daldinia caldariorum]KAI1471411.1 ribonuclease H-like domain-containing protein [Daldinia caldariorum]
MEDTPMDDSTVALETPADNVFVPPSIHRAATLSGETYTHFSAVPPSLLPKPSSPSTSTSTSPSSSPLGPPCVLGVDEAGRGPVLGPMVYGVFYLPVELSDPLLKQTHHFDDSKVLTPAVRSQLMQSLCTPPSPSSSSSNSSNDLFSSCGWAVSCLSARDIGANMLRPSTSAAYNLNAQAFDATVELVRGVLARGVNVAEIYIDTVGPPAAYQAKLARVFPAVRITVAKKADSLYPCVSAASVCAKVTRDAALEVLYEARAAASAASAAGEGQGHGDGQGENEHEESWGSGYPSDAKCVSWLRRNMHPVFGWGPECRFSWGTAKDMLETKGGVKVEWPLDEDEENSRLTDYFADSSKEKDADELGSWFGTPAGLEAF